MPPIFISPLAKIAVAAVGATALVSWAVREAWRLQEELARVSRASEMEAGLRPSFPTLRRDPRTGDWRLQTTENR
jgi:hypothetical protein